MGEAILLQTTHITRPVYNGITVQKLKIAIQDITYTPGYSNTYELVTSFSVGFIPNRYDITIKDISGSTTSSWSITNALYTAGSVIQQVGLIQDKNSYVTQLYYKFEFTGSTINLYARAGDSGYNYNKYCSRNVNIVAIMDL